ncbi:hypothetical protein NE857_09230 [Nocardiopsis exhalans]|uniref:Uncharacterized protein n=1 Tax=Nocardiopsis exhalans TaxID=163604 RepID=A0ABY5DFC0_9ACTN|nr:hypothetical protein [Nocardiopsis exhalans]USY21763.1 hypothetical protein NE857_09230 [Nocardiopsis exhalans]
MDIAAHLSQETGYAGAWDIAVEVTGLRGTVTSAAAGNPMFTSVGVFNKDTYSEAVRVSSIEMEKPGWVTEHLVGSLLRTFRTDELYAGLLSDEDFSLG